MGLARLFVCVALTLIQPPPELSGTWASELGPVTLSYADGRVTGFWMTRSGQRGLVENGRVDGQNLILEYSWPWVSIRGVASFSWNRDSRRWEGNWRHASGTVGIWNLSDWMPPQEPKHDTPEPPEPAAPADALQPPPPAQTTVVTTPAGPQPVPPAPAPIPIPESTPLTATPARPVPAPAAPVAPAAPAPEAPRTSVGVPAVAPTEPTPGSAGYTLGPIVIAPASEWALEKQDATVIVLRRVSDLAGVQIRTLGPASGTLDEFVDRMRTQTQQFGGSGVVWVQLPDTVVAGAAARQIEIEVSGTTATVKTRQAFFDVAGARFVASLGCDPGVYAGAAPGFDMLLRTVRTR